jgi:hypothetical protein
LPIVQVLQQQPFSFTSLFQEENGKNMPNLLKKQSKVLPGLRAFQCLFQ